MNDKPDVVLVPIPRALLAAAAPEWVSQTTSELVFGVPPERFTQWCKTGKIPAHRVGHLWLARAVDVRALLEAGVRVHKRERPKTTEDEKLADFEAWAFRGRRRKAG
jgi:hypothetical protein